MEYLQREGLFTLFSLYKRESIAHGGTEHTHGVKDFSVTSALHCEYLEHCGFTMLKRNIKTFLLSIIEWNKQSTETLMADLIYIKSNLCYLKLKPAPRVLEHYQYHLLFLCVWNSAKSQMLTCNLKKSKAIVSWVCFLELVSLLGESFAPGLSSHKHVKIQLLTDTEFINQRFLI